MADLSTAVPTSLVPIQGGEFTMGDDRGRADERPAHRITLASFRAAVRPVRNAEFAAFVGATGAEPPRFWDDPIFNASGQPVVGVSWFEAVAYCDWLSAEAGLRFRLPTEAEREFAARGGLDGCAWPWGDLAPGDRAEMAEIAFLQRTHPPLSSCANGFGLMCMAENVHEWCSDWYDPAYYAVSPRDNPRGPAGGRRRASRGGAWRHQIKFNRCAARSSLDPTFRYNDYGFRVYADG